jgi:hypothetical protein
MHWRTAGRAGAMRDVAAVYVQYLFCCIFVSVQRFRNSAWQVVMQVQLRRAHAPIN